MTDTWIILGATSGIARAFIRALAERGPRLILAARNETEMQAIAADASAHGAEEVDCVTFDIRKPSTFEPLLKMAKDTNGAVSVAVFVGTMPPQADIDAKPALIDGVVMDSFTGPSRFLSAIAPILEEKGAGQILGVGSVAGDRGRVTNYVYGGAKAGFHAYLSGLRNRMARSGVHVMTVKPGPVDTAMTFGEDAPLMVQPEVVAKDMLRGLDKNRNVIYSAKIWRWVMLIIRAVPEPIFKKTSF